MTGYIFTWEPEKTGKWIEDKYDVDGWFGEDNLRYHVLSAFAFLFPKNWYAFKYASILAVFEITAEVAD